MFRRSMVAKCSNFQVFRWMTVCLIAALFSLVLTSSAPTVSAQSGYEGDVTPRPTGKNGASTAADVEQMGRFVMKLDSANNGSEFQRADSAPRATRGDGRIGMADVVQTLRYSAGLDPLTTAAGPSAQPSNSSAAVTTVRTEAVSEVRVGTATFGAGTMTIPVELGSMGTENALGFSIAFDPSKLSNPVVNLGSDAANALLLVNPADVNSGRIGIGLALPAGQTFTAGVRQLVRITFTINPASYGMQTPVGFASDPVDLEISDPLGNLIEQRIFVGTQVTLSFPAPTLSSLNPNTAFAGDLSFTLGVIGTNFVNGSIVRWTVGTTTTNLTTTFQNATLLTAAVPAALIATAGSATVTVLNPTPGGGPSNGLTFNIINPVPSLTGLGFSTIAAGGGAGTLTVTGNGFVPGTVVFWNGRPSPTRFISRTQLIVDYAAADIACSGLVRVTVVSPAPGGGTSVVQTFSIAPTVTSISPTMAFVGGNSLTLTVNGTGFCEGARIRVNGTPRASTVVSPTQITTTITAADLANPATLQISVLSGDNQVVSNSLPFTVDACSPAQARVTVASTLDFGTTEPARGDIANRPSQTFTVQNAGCQPLTLVFAVRRTGEDVTSGKITNTDDSGTFMLFNITGGATTLIRSGNTIVIPGNRTWTFRLVFDPKIPAPAGGLTNLSAAQVIPDVVTSTLQILQGTTVIGTSALTGRVENNSRFINPLAPRLDPLVVFIKSGADEFTVEASGYDADSNINTFAYQFYDAAGNRVGSPQSYDINLRTLGILKGQSFSIVKKFTAKDSGQNANQVQVFFYDADGKQSFATSGPVGTGRGRIVNATTVSAASYAPGSVATEGIVSVFGEDFGTTTEAAKDTPLPTRLGDVRVYVTDANWVEREAPLFFVSPTQINYLVPEGTASGEAKVVIASKGKVISTGTVQVADMAPAFFTANADGKGAPAAYAVRVKADHSQVNEAVAEFDAVQKKFVPAPISLGTPEEQVFLVLFGTGIRYYSGMNNVKATIAGVEAEVHYAGPQGQYVGLDQVNIRVPRSALVGGEVDLVLSVDGKKSNPVRLHIR
ncbi:MAG TPA: IPT/TIG domain-containing protein [Blastocatellia bacterium]|nr:IPT/TIG domain-containing protein [Blastocatellia bacterium]